MVELADRLGLTEALSEAMAPTRERRSAHDPGVVLRDLAVAIADGGDHVTDLGVLRGQAGTVRGGGLRDWKAPVSRSTLSESHGFVSTATVAALADASRSEPVGRAQRGVGAPFSSRQRSAKRAGGSIPSAECGCSVL